MSTPTRWRALAAGSAAIAALTLSACDLQTDADLERGEVLFRQKCGSCHALAALGTADAALPGPNLDAAFADARESGMDEDTIEGVVEDQIDNPREIRLPPDDPQHARVYMPPDLVTGQDAEDVAAYVASVAGVPGIEPDLPDDPGAQVFASNGCGGCHTLQALGEQAVGASGPNLDESLPGQSPQRVEQSITDPSAELVAGFPDIMPAFELPPEELQDLVKFLLAEAGEGGGTGGGPAASGAG